MISERIAVLSLAVSMTAAIGCGTTMPPKELVDARVAFNKAKEGKPQKLAPAELDDAKQALAAAESAFEDDPEAPHTKDLAYIAERKAQLAMSSAAITEAERQRATAEEAYKDYSAEELEKARKEVEAQKQALEKSKEQLEEEREARKEAERIAQAALKSLQEVAAVKEEARGVVITLSGSVLFASGKSTLLPIAKEKLNQVAKTLKDGGDPPIRIEGHTDSTGSATENRKLSLERANAVRDHLVSQGMSSSKITTKGLGPDHPVADNDSAEGRANNRRVEIIVNPTD